MVIGSLPRNWYNSDCSTTTVLTCFHRKSCGGNARKATADTHFHGKTRSRPTNTHSYGRNIASSLFRTCPAVTFALQHVVGKPTVWNGKLVAPIYRSCSRCSECMCVFSTHKQSYIPLAEVVVFCFRSRLAVCWATCGVSGAVMLSETHSYNGLR